MAASSAQRERPRPVSDIESEFLLLEVGLFAPFLVVDHGRSLAVSGFAGKLFQFAGCGGSGLLGRFWLAEYSYVLALQQSSYSRATCRLAVYLL